MNDRDFIVNGINYKCSKMNAMDQFHVVRRMAPLLGALLPVIGELSKTKKADADMDDHEKMESIIKFATPLMTGLSKLTDDEANKILLTLLSTVEMQQTTNGGYQKVVKDGVLLFQNMEFAAMIQVAGRAFMYNLSGFFAVLPQASPGGK